MSAIVKISSDVALSAMTDAELISVLQVSVYPGAKVESIKMVIGYCKATGLDPLQKPVHIVPMKVSTGEKDNRGYDIKADRDVIMPGVGLYRTQAARSGVYAGVGDPEFGPTKQLTFETDRWVDDDDGGRRKKVTSQSSVEYPEWCRVVVTRLVDGSPCEFSAKEYWLENYATKGPYGVEPNQMWRKRPFGQIAKCAEAQALRKAFPEMTGSQPTAEEMEGKHFAGDDGNTIDMGSSPPPPPPPAPKPDKADKPEFDDAQFTKRKAKLVEFFQAGKTVDEIITFYGSQSFIPEAMAKRIRDLHAEVTKKVTDVEPKVTYAEVADKLVKAADLDQLADAGDLIGAVADESQRGELIAIHARRMGELS